MLYSFNDKSLWGGLLCVGHSYSLCYCLLSNTSSDTLVQGFSTGGDFSRPPGQVTLRNV